MRYLIQQQYQEESHGTDGIDSFTSIRERKSELVIGNGETIGSNPKDCFKREKEQNYSVIQVNNVVHHVKAKK